MGTIKKSSVPKTNGLSHGLNLYQIASYFLLISKVVFFSFLILPKFPLVFQIISSIIYYFSTLVTIYTGYLATISDPTDEIVLEERKARLSGDPFDSSRYDYQCDFCGTSVSGESKHCRSCDRCVKNFDHHCKWINNCVAEKNYKLFLTMIISLAVSTFWFTLNGLLFILDYYTEDLGLIKNIKSYKNDATEDWKIYVVIAYTLLIAIFWALDTRLLFFHAYLIRNDMTTYEHIMKIRSQQKPNKTKTGFISKRSKAKIIPIEPQSPDGEDEAMNFEGQSENKEINPDKNAKVTRIEIIAKEDLDKDGEIGNSGLEQAIQNQTADEIELKHQLSIKSGISNSHKQLSDSSPYEGSQKKLLSPMTLTSNIINISKLEKNAGNDSTPPKSRHRFIKQLTGVDNSVDHTTLSIFPDSVTMYKRGATPNQERSKEEEAHNPESTEREHEFVEKTKSLKEVIVEQL